MTSNILIDLSEYLKDTDLFKFILPIIDEYVRYTFKTSKELKQAVTEWCADINKKKKYAEKKIWPYIILEYSIYN